MLSDMPTVYESEPEITKFLEKVLTVRHETGVLDGEIGEFASLARIPG